MVFSTAGTSSNISVTDTANEPRRRSLTKTSSTNDLPLIDSSSSESPDNITNFNDYDKPGSATLSAGSSSSSISSCDGLSSYSSQRLDSALRPISRASNPICRICHEENGNDKLISPCYCSGTIGMVHMICMEQWLTSNSSDTCELCHFQFLSKKSPKSFSEFFKDLSRGQHDQRVLLADTACLALLAFISIVGVIFCIKGAHQQVIDGDRIPAAILVTVSVILMIVFAAWVGLTVRFYYTQWKKWQIKNCNIEKIIFKCTEEELVAEIKTVAE